MSSEELDSCELGTKEYWAKTYTDEIKNFEDYGDIGDVWFGEDTMTRILKWMEKSPLINKEQRIIDLGCGNGYMLVELAKAGFSNILGIDYAEEAIKLAENISKAQNLNIEFKVCDLLNKQLEETDFDVTHDKGTYDAVSLSEKPKENRMTYIDTVHKMLKKDGIFIITSCNWTKDELCEQFNGKFECVDVVPMPQFKFGGKVGNVVTSLIFKKI